MNRIVGSIVSLVQHLSTVFTEPEVYRPAACPHCGRGGLWHHGCYHRKADRIHSGEESLNPVPVRRFLCPGCTHTCSRLPACIPPRRWYDWFVQQAVLLLLLCGASLGECERCTGRPRDTVRRWRDWLCDRSDEFALFLRSRFPELGRLADFESFWRHVLVDMTLQQSMVWLDKELVVP
jgi:hypothetical protein